MKRFLLLTLIMGSVSAFAYIGGHGKMQLLFDELDLTADQQKELTIIKKESRAERLKLMDALDDLQNKTQTRIKAVLTKDQLVRYKELRQNRMNGKRSGGPGAGMNACGSMRQSRACPQ